MPNLTMQAFAPAAVVGVLSAAANVVEKQAKARNNGNVFFANASLWGDIAIGGYAVANYMSPRGWYPTHNGTASAAMAGAGVALLARRASDYIGATFLKLPTGSRYSSTNAIPGRSVVSGRSLRSPAAAVETSVLPRKRQFFSVT
jgi:pyocin large subunit-like protein